MSSWVKVPGGRRPQTMPNGGSAKPYRPYRRSPYPVKEEQAESQSFKDSDQQHEELSGIADYERHQYSQNGEAVAISQLKKSPASPKAYAPAEKRSSLYQRFYQQVQQDYDKQPSDCVVLSVNNQNTDYAKSIGHCLQDRGLSMEMINLQAESGLTRALQEVRADGSPLCILVEQTNVALSSCTVIIFSESLKIHRNMPKEQAMDLVMVEHGRLLAERQKEERDVAGRAASMVEDYLEREKLEKHEVAPSTRHLLLLMADGLHLYPEELGKLAEYVHVRQDRLQESTSKADNGSFPSRRKILPSGLGKPPPLLPTPPGPHVREHSGHPKGVGEHLSTPLLPTPGQYPKTKPPPLLSIQSHPVASLRSPLARGPSAHYSHPSLLGPHGPPLHHGPAPLRGPPLTRSPTPNPGLPPRGPLPSHGPHGAPPSLKSLKMGDQPGLLPHPGGITPRPNMPRH